MHWGRPGKQSAEVRAATQVGGVTLGGNFLPKLFLFCDWEEAGTLRGWRVRAGWLHWCLCAHSVYHSWRYKPATCHTEAKKALEPIMPLCTGWRCLWAPPAPSPFLWRAALRCLPTPQTMHAAFALVAHDHLRCVCWAFMVGWVPNVPYLAESSQHSGELGASASRAWTPRSCSDVTQPGK